ncbi:MAG: riboflavin kinase, partial [Tissierellia bacterium]|nr:riboflavin kinase [Tissierellia bacterium]
KIVGGYQRGSKIGFKTANTPWPSGVVIPKYGVYSTRVFLEGNEYDALTMVGIPYTFHKDRFTVETHIFNFNRDIYGENIQIEFLEYIRENRKFKDLEELRSQLLLDKLEAMKIRSK